MSTTTAQPGLYPIPPRNPPVRWLRWLLLLAVVVPSVLSALYIPVKVSPDRLLADLQAGEVHKVSLTCGESLEVGEGGVSFTIGSSVDLSNTLCWTDGTLHYRTSLATLLADLSAQTRGQVDVLGTVRATAATAGQPQPRVVQDLLPGWSSLMALPALVYAVAFVSTIVVQQASGHGPAGLGAAFCAYFPEDC